MPMAFLDPGWCGLDWTPFAPFEAGGAAFRSIPPQPGVYRVRVTGKPVLVYVGQTGRNLRERLNDLRRNTLADQCPFNDPHTAAPKLWSYRHADGLRYECSAAPAASTHSQRHALECSLVWRYRVATGGSPLCNFGRLHPSYRTSRNRSTADRGGPLPGGQCNPGHAPSVPPLRAVGYPSDTGWMGLGWSPLSPLSRRSAADAPGCPGVYKLLDGQSWELLYVGESSSLRTRLRTHAASARGGRTVQVSYCPLPSMTAVCQRLEVECDLIGGYHFTTGRVPPLQFGAEAAAPEGSLSASSPAAT